MASVLRKRVSGAMVSNELNNKISELWNRHPLEVRGKNHPLYYPKFKTEGILFIGINPSFSIKGFKQTLKGTEYEGIDIEKFYSFDNQDFDVEKAIAIEASARKQHDYFQRFNKIAKETGKDWEHIDLFLYRQTSQSDFKKIIGFSNKNGKLSLNEFGREQLDLIREKIKKIAPKVIVVVNALASEILRKEFVIEKLDYDSKDGFQRLEIDETKIPIFFSGMLTGQRALDNGSFDRLIWHIKRALSK